MFHTKPRNKGLLLLVLLFPLSSHALHNLPNKPLIFGFLPSRSPVTLFKQYTPLREYLSAHLKHPILLETTADYPTF